MKSNFIALAMVLLPMLTIAQSHHITGSVVDENDSELPSATIVLLSQVDSTMTGFALSADDGRWIIRDISSGKYMLQVSYLGYEQYNQNLAIKDVDLDIGAIRLQPSSVGIQEIVVEGETTPIQVKKDTLVYNANAFKTQPNDVVEDLLRQMPGVEVEDDGTIVAQGEEIEQVTVDGKEFFGKDPSIATRNLPAKAVDKVEIFDQRSDRAEFSGVDDGERTKTMNLELKEAYKKGFFGNVEAGVGADTGTESLRYKTRGNVNRFSKKSQLSIIANANNINEQGFSSGDYFSIMSSMGGFGRSNRSQIGSSGMSINQGLSDGFIETTAGGLNWNYDFSPETDLNVSYFINDIQSAINSISSRESFVDDARSFFTNERLDQVDANRSHNVNIRLEHEIDSSQNIRLLSALKYQVASVNSDLETVTQEGEVVRNTGIQTSNDEKDVITPSGSVLYNKKFGQTKKHIVSLETSLNRSQDDGEGALSSLNDLAPDDATVDMIRSIVQQSFDRDEETAYTLEATFTEPIAAGHYVDLSYQRSNVSNDVSSEIYDLENGTSVLNDMLSTMYIRDYTYDRFGVAWQYNNEVSTLTIGGNIQHSVLEGDILDINQTINNDNTAFLPRMSYRREMGRGHNFSLRYNTNINQPSLRQLQPVTDRSNPLSLYIGNPNLEVEYQHRLRMNYIKWDQFNFSSLFGFMTINYTRDKIVNQSFIDENLIQTTAPVNIKDDLSIRANISYSRPIRSIGAKIRLSTNGTYQNSTQFINLEENQLNRYISSVGVTLENRNKDNFSIDGTVKWTYNTTLYSESTDQNLNFLNQSYKLGVRLDAIDTWSFASDIDIRHFSEQDYSPAETIPIWTASISRYFLEGDKGEFRLSAYDLLNQNQGINRTSNANYIENENINSLGRYFMAGFLYSFSSAGGQAGAVGRSPRKVMMIGK